MRNCGSSALRHRAGLFCACIFATIDLDRQWVARLITLVGQIAGLHCFIAQTSALGHSVFVQQVTMWCMKSVCTDTLNSCFVGYQLLNAYLQKNVQSKVEFMLQLQCTTEHYSTWTSKLLKQLIIPS